MIKRLLLIVMIFVGYTTVILADNVSEQEKIKQLLQQRDKEIKTLMGPKGTKHTPAQTNKLKAIVNDIVDFEAMAKMALQDTWTVATPQQQKEFVTLFGKIIRDQSLAKPEIYRSTVTYQDIQVSGNTAQVKTIASYDNVKTPVSYTMIKKNNSWYITDIIIDKVSTAASYQKSFQNTIRKKGFTTLLDALRKRAERA